MKAAPLFGYGSESVPRKGRPTLVRGKDEHERWADAILPADSEAGAVAEGETSKRPIIIGIALVVLLLAVLVGRLISLQVLNGHRNLSLANGNRIRQKVVRAPRGVIYDRSRGILARNTANFDLTVTPAALPQAVAERQAVYARVAGLTGLSIAEVSAKPESLLADPKQTASLMQPVLVSQGLTRDNALNLDQGSVDTPGFSLDVNPVREYLDSSQLSAFLGYTGRVSADELKADDSYLPTDYIGKLGLEKQYEDILRGQNGSEQTEVDAAGRPIRLLASKPAQAGNNIVLSIDRGLQDKLTQSLQVHLAASPSKRGAAVALDPRNGEVLAAVSLPSYDNNKFSKGISSADYTSLINDKAQPLFNKVIAGSYPSGSIIKPIVAGAALDEKVVTPATIIEDKGSLQVVNKYNKDITYTFFGWEHSGLGLMNIYRAIAMSSDIYFYTVAGGYGNFVGMGIDKLASYYQRFGLGARTGVDMPDETLGRVPTPEWKQRVMKESWFTGDTYNVSVGQGDILVSPLQMASAIAAIANGGTLYKPRFLNAVTDYRGNVVQASTPVVTRKNLLSKSALDNVRQGMRQTITEGTACCMIEQQVPVRVAGKTGTAETDPGNKKLPNAWFEAYAPFENPQIVVVALVENSGEGAEYAAPVVREALQYYFSRK